MDSATVGLVTDTATCTKALAAYLSSLPPDYPRPLPTTVYVVKGGSVYVVMHPTPDPGRNRRAVLDSAFNVLASYAY